MVESSKPGLVGAAAVLEFWVGILTQQNLWYRDKTVLFLMDQICCAAFTYHQEECVQKLLYQQHKVFTKWCLICMIKQPLNFTLIFNETQTKQTGNKVRKLISSNVWGGFCFFFTVFHTFCRLLWVIMETGVCSLLWLAGFLEMPHPPSSRANP